MTILPRCPSCGLESAEIRCPRCNALKVVGCSGVCSECTSGCDVEPDGTPAKPRPGADEAEGPGDGQR